MLTPDMGWTGALNGRNYILLALPWIAMDSGESVPTAVISIVLLV
jgi:hypothetical protein